MKQFIFLGLFTVIMACGSDGDRGVQGPVGPVGAQGESAQQVKITLTRFTSDTTVCESGAGVMIKSISYYYFFGSEVDTVVAASVVCDGVNGTNGADAPSSNYQITEIVDPCGDALGIDDEVLLKTASGQLIASISDKASGKNTRISILSPGSYVTTDGSNCHYTVNADGTIS